MPEKNNSEKITFELTKNDFFEQINPDNEELLTKIENLSETEFSRLVTGVRDNLVEDNAIGEAIDTAIRGIDDIIDYSPSIEEIHTHIKNKEYGDAVAKISLYSAIGFFEEYNLWLKRQGFSKKDHIDWYTKATMIYMNATH
jgi:methionine synthase II (cobalamin-independent)